MTVVIENGAMSSSLPLSLSQRKIGKIHSRFRHSFNICFEDELVNINIMENQLSSFGINIEKDLMSILLDDLKEDDLVNMDRNQLVLFPTFGEVYEINLGRLQIIDLALEATLPTPGRLSLLTDLFSPREYLDHSGLPLHQGIENHLYRLSEISGQTAEFAEELKYFVGRGKGLTPSGDDLLMGYFLIEKLFHGSSTLLDSLMRFIQHHTTAISVAYLRSLKDGFISQYYQEFCQAVDHQDLPTLRNTIEKIKTIGSTSGYDSLLGMSIALGKTEAGNLFPPRFVNTYFPYLSHFDSL